MDIKYDGNIIYYQDKYKFIKSLLAWSLFFIAIIMLFADKWNMYRVILGTVRLLVCVTLLMFVSHSYDINPVPIYKVVKINITIIVIISILQIVYFKHLNVLSYFLEISYTSNYKDNSIIYFSLMYHILAKYRSEDNRNILTEYKIWLTIIILINMLSKFYIENNIAILIVNKIMMEIFFILAIKDTYKEKIIKDGKINVFKVSIIISFICTNIMDIYKLANLTQIYLIIGSLNFAIIIASLTLIIESITKNMYSFIFKDIHNINEKLDEINYEIIIRNEELEKYEVEIEKKRKSYRELLKLLPKAIIIVNVTNNRIIYCNPDFQELIGIKKIRKVINKKVEDIVKLNFDYRNLKDLGGKEVYFGTTILNNERQLEIRLSNYNKNTEEITMIFEDITEREKIERIKSEIESQKVNDNIKKNFLSNVSHDFKTPINIIYSSTQLENLLISNNDITAVRKYNAISKKNCLTLIRLTNNIIDISKINSEDMNIKLEVGNIVEFVENKVTELVEYAVVNKINVIFDTDEEELYMNFDKEFMERIILNLVSNAVKFTPQNGTISIDISHNEESIFIVVKDTGIGMDEDFASKAFTKYSMSVEGGYKNSQGTGVGLYVVYNLVSLQKGEIWINSKVGEGTKFTMKFCRE